MKHILAIPSAASSFLIPDDHLNVVDLASFSIPSDRAAPKLLDLSDDVLFCDATSNSLEPQALFKLLQSLNMPSAEDVSKLKARRDGMASSKPTIRFLQYPRSNGNVYVQLPLWTIEYWLAASQVLHAKRGWEAAIAWLRQKNSKEAIDLLKVLPWKAALPKHVSATVTDLAGFCSRKWLGTDHMDILITVLNDQLNVAQVQASIEPMSFAQKLIALYRNHRDRYFDENHFVRAVDQKLTMGQVEALGAAVGVCINEKGVQLPPGDADDVDAANHWCAFAVNIQQRALYYADSFGYSPPAELLDVLKWWLGLFFKEAFSIQSMTSTRQSDKVSCSILSINALAHHFLPSVPLIPNGPPCIQARIDALINAIKLFQKLVSCCMWYKSYYSIYVLKGALGAATSTRDSHQITLFRGPASDMVQGVPWNARRQIAQLKLHFLSARLRTGLRRLLTVPNHSQPSKALTAHMQQDLRNVMLHIGHSSIMGFALPIPHFLTTMSANFSDDLSGITFSTFRSLDEDFNDVQDRAILGGIDQGPNWWDDPLDRPRSESPSTREIHQQFLQYLDKVHARASAAGEKYMKALSTEPTEPTGQTSDRLPTATPGSSNIVDEDPQPSGPAKPESDILSKTDIAELKRSVSSSLRHLRVLEEQINHEVTLAREAAHSSQWDIGAYDLIGQLHKRLQQIPFDPCDGSLVVPESMYFPPAPMVPMAKHNPRRQRTTGEESQSDSDIELVSFIPSKRKH
ncbi:hypothetical protein CVT26_015804 [Gymnopilus dilepis]|uniref:Ubiquitin-like protease family profile domain-containing protein n=1 Tax=Gymnopilus dilepis TaxID=231916 RepID=A0A409WXD5_9AGAR|nr:hypothetical protein CVT26_015804 [Gymnopilus dilepis]